jgi:hypothetical protein
MNLFALFLVACFVGGVLFEGRPGVRRWSLVSLSLMLMVAYYFFNRI